jgi:RimJ/RimL family protein N-acetyltransferase
MKAARIYDADIIKGIMTMPAIWATIAEDGMSIEDYTPNLDDCWLLMTNGEDEVTGLYRLHPHNSVTLEIHAQVIPEFREKHSFETGKAALIWFLREAPANYQKVIAQIPTFYQNVIKFTRSFGFQLEGVNRLADRINGNLYDVVLLGMTRPEIEAKYNV